MPLPETIPVRYTEEEAGYVTVRPLVRQTFRLDELLDMILSVAGKDVARIRQLLHSGTVVYHFYRYSWTGFDADEAELAAALARFPDADPARPFAAEPVHELPYLRSPARIRGTCWNWIARQAPSAAYFADKVSGSACWKSPLEENPAYQKYSYGRRADLYRLDLDAENISRIAEAANRLAPESCASALRVLPRAACILFVCPR